MKGQARGCSLPAGATGQFLMDLGQVCPANPHLDFPLVVYRGASKIQAALQTGSLPDLSQLHDHEFCSPQRSYQLREVQ